MEKRLMTVVAGLALSTSMAFAQSQISGHVTSSEDGSPVIGASIKVAGTNTGTVTDIDGVKLDFPDKLVHLRKSNTEPIIRVYSEAKTADEADAIGKKLMQVVYDMQ